MLAPDYLDHAPDRLILLWQQAEDDIPVSYTHLTLPTKA